MKGHFSLILFLSLSLAGSAWADPEIRAYLDAERSKLPPKTVKEVEENGQKIRTLVRDQNYYMDLFFERLDTVHGDARRTGGERHLHSSDSALKFFYSELEKQPSDIEKLCKSDHSLESENNDSILCNSVINETQKIASEILKKFKEDRKEVRTVKELPVEYDIKYCYYALKDEKGKEIERRLELSFENVNIGFEHPINKGVFLYDDFFRESAPEKSSSPLTLHVSVNGSEFISHLDSKSPGFSNDATVQSRKLESDSFFIENLSTLPLKVRLQRGIRSLQLQYDDQNAVATSVPVSIEEFDLTPTLRNSEYCAEATNQRDVLHRKATIKFPKPIHLWAY